MLVKPLPGTVTDLAMEQRHENPLEPIAPYLKVLRFLGIFHMKMSELTVEVKDKFAVKYYQFESTRFVNLPKQTFNLAT